MLLYLKKLVLTHFLQQIFQSDNQKDSCIFKILEKLYETMNQILKCWKNDEEQQLLL